MAISFNTLPTNSPANKIEPGKYYARIEEAKMKEARDPNKPPYLNLKYKLTKPDGTSAGVLFDILSESTSEYVLYKIKCFMDAIGFNPGNTFELRDLAKVCQGREIIIPVSMGKDANGNDRAQVNIFNSPVYYPKSAGAELFGDFTEVPTDYFDGPAVAGLISASDATDAISPDLDEF